MNKSSDFLYERMKDGDETAIVEIYDSYQVEFLNFFKKYDINRQSVLDIFQDSIIVIYQKIYVGNLDLKTSSLKTYLFGVGKNKVYDYFKKKQIQTNDLESLKTESKHIKLDEVPNIYEKKLADGLKQISESCQHILNLFYYRGLSIKEIVDQTDYKDNNTVKSHKSRCLKKLKELCKA